MTITKVIFDSTIPDPNSIDFSNIRGYNTIQNLSNKLLLLIREDHPTTPGSKVFFSSVYDFSLDKLLTKNIMDDSTYTVVDTPTLTGEFCTSISPFFMVTTLGNSQIKFFE